MLKQSLLAGLRTGKPFSLLVPVSRKAASQGASRRRRQGDRSEVETGTKKGICTRGRLEAPQLSDGIRRHLFLSWFQTLFFQTRKSLTTMVKPKR